MPDYVPASWANCLEAQDFLREALRANGSDEQYFELERLLNIGIRPCLKRPICPDCYRFTFELLQFSQLLYSEMQENNTPTVDVRVDMNAMVSSALAMIHSCPTYTEYANMLREEIQLRILVEQRDQQQVGEQVARSVDTDVGIIQDDGHDIGDPMDVDGPPVETTNGGRENAPVRKGEKRQHENAPGGCEESPNKIAALDERATLK